MINKVKFTILRQFLGLYCLSKRIIRLTHDVFSISLLFRIVSSLNQFHVPLFTLLFRIVSSLNQFHVHLFMYNKVKLTILRQFPGLYCLSKLIIRLTHDVFSISLLFMIVSSLNQFHLPLFMINKVNVELLRQFLDLYCLSKLIIRLTHDVFSISLLFRFVSSLNQFHVPLFLINKVKLTILRQFLGLYCLSKRIIRLTHDVFSISLLFS